MPSKVNAKACSFLALVAIAGALVAPSGCEKPPPPKKKEVAEAPPPPPPPPPAVSFETLTQELKADPRVQVAQGLSVGDESYARASIKLADAIARGNTAALKPLLAQRAGGVLSTLESNDLWAPAVKGIEAVRIVSAGPPPSNLMSGDASTDNQAATKDSVVALILSKIPPESHEKIKPLLEENVEKAIADAGAAPKMADVQAKLLPILAAAGVTPRTEVKVFSSAATMQLVLAVQDSAGAYLCGWQASKNGDAWVFDGVATTPDVRPRASAWDGIGPAAFAVNTDSGSTDPTRANDGTKTADGQPKKDGEPAGPQDRKNTPAGPVTIPRRGPAG